MRELKNNMEFAQARRYRSEWSYGDPAAWSGLEKELGSFLDSLKDKSTDTVFEKRKKQQIATFKEQVEKLGFWSDIKIDTSAEEGEELLAAFPSSPYVYHFHPLGFIKQMKRIYSVCTFCKVPSIMNSGCPYQETGRAITEVDYDNAANDLGIEKELMKAIGKKETKSKSFYKAKQAIILFERHKMYSHLKTADYSDEQLSNLQKENSDIIHPKKSTNYGTTEEQYTKLEIAKSINYDAAIKSCSWGKFQIMGETYDFLFSSLKELENSMNLCEMQQFQYFISFLQKKSGMLQSLKDKNWEGIASAYNGKNWKNDNPTYATDIEKYYNEFINTK
jgi:hypothetical protein